MNIVQLQRSTQDASINLIYDNQAEARYIRREDDKLLVYLSTQAGCKQACRFCHLTQTGQTTDTDMRFAEIINQASDVFGLYQSSLAKGGARAKRVNFNFMARGEPLDNVRFRCMPDVLFEKLQAKAQFHGLLTKINISTIMPFQVYDAYLKGMFSRSKVPHHFYYSMYSVNPAFRKRWLPKAMEPQHALRELKKWQDATGFHLVFHHAFIEGENDSLEDVEKFLETIRPFKLKAKFNAVRYNPFSSAQGQESSEEVIERNFALIAKEMTMPGSRIVPRVGFDVHASCGLFYNAGNQDEQRHPAYGQSIPTSA